jgi:hypothetical protein
MRIKALDFNSFFPRYYLCVRSDSRTSHQSLRADFKVSFGIIIIIFLLNSSK